MKRWRIRTRIARNSQIVVLKVSETHLHGDTKAEDVAIYGYTCIHIDCNTGPAGETCCFVRNKVMFEPRRHLELAQLEATWIVGNSSSILICILRVCRPFHCSEYLDPKFDQNIFE